MGQHRGRGAISLSGVAFIITGSDDLGGLGTTGDNFPVYAHLSETWVCILGRPPPPSAALCGPVLGVLANIPIHETSWSKPAAHCSVAERAPVCAGVADGVGGWAATGVDAGEYSRLLMAMAKLFSEASRTPPTPSQVLHSAYNQTQVTYDRCPGNMGPG